MREVKMAMFLAWSLLLTLTARVFPIQAVKVEELSDDPRSFLPLPVYPSVSYQILNAEPLFLRDAGRELIGNASRLTQLQTFMLSNISSGQQPSPSINANYGQMSVERAIPQEMLQTGPRIRAFILARQVRSSAPIMRVLFHVARSGRGDPRNTSTGESGPRTGKSGFICVMTHAFWETREVRGACSVPAEGGYCLARLKPEPAWFGLGSGKSSQGSWGDGQGNTVELYYQTRTSPTSQCSPQDGQTRRGQAGLATALRYGASGPRMKRIGSLSLLRSPPGNPTFMRVKLGGTVVIQTSSKPVKTTDTATFYVFLPSASPVERLILRTTVKKGLSFSAARPSDPSLWDVALEPSKAGDEPQTLYVVCQKKSSPSGKRGLLEVLQLDFEAEEFSDQSEGQLVTWRLELPGNIKDEGSMTIYTTQKDFIGLAPLIMDTELLNTAILNGKRVSVPVTVLAVEADGSVTDITNSSSCQSTDTDTLKVSERCDFVYMDGKETGGRVRMLVNFTYSYLSAQLEVSVWMPRLPLHIELSDSELSQIKGWRVPVSAVSQRKSSWDSEEEEDRKARGCMLQYQHARVRVLTPFLADGDDPAAGTMPTPPAYFLGPDWQVDVTRLVQESMRVADSSVARLQAGTVLAGRAVGVTTVQVMSPLSDSVLAERMVRVLEDKVSITELGVQLVSGLSLNLQLSPGSNRAIIATATTQELMQSPKQEALISPWVQFSDGSLTSLDLFDPSGYTLSASSLDDNVATVRQGPHPQLTAVAEGDGQGSLLRVELGICEACQKSKRKSKLAVGSGDVRVKLLPPEEGVEATGRTEDGAGGVADRRNPSVDAKVLDVEIQQALTSPRAVPLNIYTQAVLRDSRVRELSTTSTLQEAMGAVAFSTVQTISSATSRPTTTTTSRIPTQGRGNGVRKEMGNLLMNSISHFGPEGPSNLDVFRKKAKAPEKKAPTEEPPAVQSSDLVRAFGIAFSDLEICVYALVGVSGLAILGFLLNCATYGLRSHGKKTPVQAAQDPREHRHHWVRLSTSSDQGRLPPPPPQTAATVACQGHPHPEPHHHHHHQHRPLEAAPPGAGMPPLVERTATLGRRSSVQPSRADSMTSRSATLLAKPVRTEPLHSPTSKRNQVQFTTFTTLDIKHLAALKRSGMEVSWAAPVANYAEPKGAPLPEIPYPTATPHVQA